MRLCDEHKAGKSAHALWPALGGTGGNHLRPSCVQGVGHHHIHGTTFSPFLGNGDTIFLSLQSSNFFLFITRYHCS